MKDFTLTFYEELLKSIMNADYKIITFNESLNCKDSRYLILRHDIDYLPENALRMALIEHKLGIKATYFFRIIPSVFNKDIILKIFELGHEIGYHYEDMNLVYDIDYDKHLELAFKSFCKNLEKIRKLVPIYTICMHGSPRSNYDNKELWTRYDYKKLDIIGEPYLDIDFSDVFYITDTGRKWNNFLFSIRDKVYSSYDIKIKNSQHLIQLFKERKLPNRIMLNTHPHRWFDIGFYWYKELLIQNIKNVIKFILIKISYK